MEIFALNPAQNGYDDDFQSPKSWIPRLFIGSRSPIADLLKDFKTGAFQVVTEALCYNDHRS
jgi:hypothetical protein